MLRVRIDEARPGMVLARPIQHLTQPGLVLLRAGASLGPLAIPRLRQIGVTHVWIEYPGLEELTKLWDPHLMHAGQDCVRQVARFIDPGLGNPSVRIDVESCRQATTSLVRCLHDAPAAQALLNELEAATKVDTLRTSIVTVLCLLMGLRLDYYLLQERSRLPAKRAKDVTPLGLGAMLHDVGMLRCDLAREARSQHTDIGLLEADARYQAHVLAGREALKGQVEPAVMAVVLHHHQRYDGSGFPRCKPVPTTRKGRPVFIAPQGRQIHAFARIAFVAQLFARLSLPEHLDGQTQASPLLPVQVLATLLSQPFRGWCDPEVLGALFRSVPAFPIGTVVRLSDGRDAAVVTFNDRDPCRPTVEIVDLDTQRPSARRERIDLTLAPQFHITHVASEPVERWLFAPIEELNLRQNLPRNAA